MPQLRPFRGLRYDPSAIGDTGAVLCPPYDVISAAEHAQLIARHERNAVRLELPVPPDGGASTSADPYAAAATTLDRWAGDGTLRRDDEPLIYVYEQQYELGGSLRVARSFFCALLLEEYGPDAGIRPHERTMSGPKEDRFRLLSAVRANLSPVLLLYDDGADGAASGGLLDQITSSPPALHTTGPAGVGQRLWAIDPARSAAAANLLGLAADRPLAIADGHHRYETALRYRQQHDAPAGAGYVLTLLYDAHSGGLSLLPWHRLISGVSDSASVFASAEDLFAAERITTSRELVDRLAATSSGVIGLWTRAGGALLKVDRERLLRLPPGDGSETVRWLDVSVLSGTLSLVIGSGAEKLSAEGRLAYVSDAREAVASVDGGRADVAFLLQPPLVDAVLSVAAEGGYMPPKSTFFHPKAATGLVFRPLDQ